MGEELRRAGGSGLIVAEVVPEGRLDKAQVQEILVGPREVLPLSGVGRVVIGRLVRGDGLATRPAEFREPQRLLRIAVVEELLLVGGELLRPGHLAPGPGVVAPLGGIGSGVTGRYGDALDVVERGVRGWPRGGWEPEAFYGDAVKRPAAGQVRQ